MNVNGIGSSTIDDFTVSKAAEVRTEHSVKESKKENKSIEEDFIKEKITPEKLDEALKNLNSSAEIVQSGLQFEKAEDAGEWVVKVVKVDSGEVIRQFPSEETLKIVKGIKEMLGAIFDKMV